jgi:hypothetical protein
MRCTETKRNPKTGLYMNDDPLAGVYLEEGEEPPLGYGICPLSLIGRRHYKPMTVDEYAEQEDVLIVRGDEVLNVLRPNTARGKDEGNAK